MVLKSPFTLRNEAWLWIVCFISALLIGTPLILASLQRGVMFQTSAKPKSHQLKTIYGQARLDLNLLAQNHSLHEADNVRWSLIRRTPLAKQVFDPTTGVNWVTLRALSYQDTLLVPDTFTWSFNETFQSGIGYKKASGILAGGHCALATVFRAAAAQAGLPTQFRRHATPIPGFAPEESVNIYWGRDDLLIFNTTGQDLYFLWRLTPEQLEIYVTPVWAYAPLPILSNFQEATIAMVYGHRAPHGWGTLGLTQTVDEALEFAREYASRVDEWNGQRPIVIAVNLNVVRAGHLAEKDTYLYQLISEARRQGIFVMLDVQSGDQEPLPLFTALMDQYLHENVWLDWDLEHTAGGGRVRADQINEIARAYFQHRQERAFQTPGIFAFYVYRTDQVKDAFSVQRAYEQGWVVPIFDGLGSAKIAKTRQILACFAPGPFGIMEFETRWGNRYDILPAHEYFQAFPDALIMVSQ